MVVWEWETNKINGTQISLFLQKQLYLTKGVFNLSHQLSNFFKNWGMKRVKTVFQEFCGLILLRECYSRS